VTYYGPFLLLAVEPVNQPDWTPNKNFRPVGKNVAAVQSYLDTGVYKCFTTDAKRHDYRTVWCAVAHSGQLFDNSPSSLLSGGYRLFATKYGKEDYDAKALNQINVVHTMAAINLFEELGRRIRVSVQDMSQHEELIIESSTIKHPKKALRIASVVDTRYRGTLGSPHIANYCVQVKRFEFMKAGKPPRLIVNLGIDAAMSGSYLMSVFKHMLEEELQCDFYSIGYCPDPSVERLSRVFSDIIQPTRRLVARVFSDDSSFSVVCTDGVLLANADLEQCDASVGKPLFDAFSNCFQHTPLHDVATQLCAQCIQPLRVINPHAPESFVVKPTTNVLYSGSVLTTALDTLASMLIYSVFSSKLNGRQTKKQAELLLIQSALECGFGMKVEVCASYHHLQFLKFSPVMSENGRLTAVLNLGVILRMMGQCVGDLPGRNKDGLERRAYLFDAGLVAGLTHAGDHELLDCLRDKYRGGTAIYTNYIVQHSSGQTHRVSSEELSKRYFLLGCEFDEMCWQFTNAKFGDVMSCPAMAKILFKDYGLDTI